MKEIKRQLQDLQGKKQQDGWSDGMVLVWLLVILSDLVDYLEEKEQTKRG